MTDLEKMRFAQKYMMELANGIDPISKKALPADTCLNNVRLARYFFFISDVLRRLIKNGGQIHETRRGDSAMPEKRLEPPLRSYLAITDAPVTITEFLRPLRELSAKRSTRSLPVTAVTGWLTEKGYLNDVADGDSRHHKTPTPAGVRLGISTEQRTSPHGAYVAVLYSANSQRFIADNLEAITQRWKST